MKMHAGMGHWLTWREDKELAEPFYVVLCGASIFSFRGDYDKGTVKCEDCKDLYPIYMLESLDI